MSYKFQVGALMLATVSASALANPYSPQCNDLTLGITRVVSTTNKVLHFNQNTSLTPTERGVDLPDNFGGVEYICVGDGVDGGATYSFFREKGFNNIVREIFSDKKTAAARIDVQRGDIKSISLRGNAYLHKWTEGEYGYVNNLYRYHNPYTGDHERFKLMYDGNYSYFPINKTDSYQWKYVGVDAIKQDQINPSDIAYRNAIVAGLGDRDARVQGIESRNYSQLKLINGNPGNSSSSTYGYTFQTTINFEDGNAHRKVNTQEVRLYEVTDPAEQIIGHGTSLIDRLHLVKTFTGKFAGTGKLISYSSNARNSVGYKTQLFVVIKYENGREYSGYTNQITLQQ
ncbi:MAG: hypothetical protein ACRDCY_04010 [Aeromonas veronii]